MKATRNIIALAAASLFAGSAFAAGGLSITGNGITGTGASTKFTITQGGSDRTVQMGTTTSAAFTIKAGDTITTQPGQPTTITTTTPGSFSQSSPTSSSYLMKNPEGSSSFFDPVNWTVGSLQFVPAGTSQLTFTPGGSNSTQILGPSISTVAANDINVAGTTYVSTDNVVTFVNDVKGVITQAVVDEVNYITGTLVADVTTKVGAYGAASHAHATEGEADASAEGAAVKVSMSALVAEVTSTGTAVGQIKALSFPTLTAAGAVVSGKTGTTVNTALDFTSVAAGAVSATGGTSTLNTSGVITFK